MRASEAPMASTDSADRDEIAQVLYLYARAIDAKQFALLDGVFVPDAIIDYAVAGGTRLPLREMVGWLGDALSMFRMTQHVISNPIIVVTGDQAESTAYLTATHEQVGLDGKRTVFVDHGIYKDDWVRTEHGWRIRARRLERFLMHGDFQMPDQCKRYPSAPQPVSLPTSQR
jgi:3-phenylpropionate/cinnamic acid dioxygenase small subunit